MMKAQAFINYWGAHPGCSPKSTPMSVAMALKTAFLSMQGRSQKKTFGGWTSGAFLLILGELLGTLRLM